VSLVKNIGDPISFSAAAYEGDGTTIDTSAVITWEVDDPSVVSLDGNTGSTTTGSAVAAGTANVTATATDADGNSVTSDPFAITVNTPATDAKSVAVTAS
jgi:hypothetical protein